jgi:CheY-like chemotaxis protein
LGIGLNIAKRLAHMHGGELDVKSDGRNKGSCFTFRMPLTLQPATGQALKTGVTPDKRSALRILVVDDNRDVATTMVLLLQRSGRSAQAAFDGEGALRIGAQFRPHLVLMDIGMPLQNGYETCKQMRAEPWGQRARIVAISGWGQEQDRERSKQAGFDEHMVKPIDGQNIQRLLKEVEQETTGATRG